MSSQFDIVGIVIAGGRSIRFGGEKAAAELSGKSLLFWAAHRLAMNCRRVAVNARPDTQAEAIARAEGWTVLHDMPGDPLGPLAGVKVGLAWAQECGARAIAVSPCDAPLLPEDLYPRLIAAAGSGAAMAETAERAQPQCAIWPVTALPALTMSLAQGEHPPTWRMLDSIGATRVRFDSAGAFTNLNTPEELAAIADRIRDGEIELR
jgi:molybdenum cofactor guanylyltransferase